MIDNFSFAGEAQIPILDSLQHHLQEVLYLQVIARYMFGNQLGQGVGTGGNNADNFSHAPGLQVFIQVLSIPGKIFLQPDVVQDSPAARLVLSQIAKLNPQPPKHLNRIQQWPSGGIAISGRQPAEHLRRVDTQLLGKAGYTHRHLGADGALVQLPYYRH